MAQKSDKPTPGTIIHGLWGTPGYWTWKNMVQRCHSTRCKDWKYYGGRGITVCDRWRNYSNFLADMGTKPSPAHSIDRIDNNGNYDSENCRWSTKKEQMRNRRDNLYLNIEGQRYAVAELAERFGIPRRLLGTRVRRGVPLNKLFNPVKKQAARAAKAGAA